MWIADGWKDYELLDCGGGEKLERWDRFITNYHLPDWDSIPDLGLYMDQVVVLLVQYMVLFRLVH